MRLLVPYWSYPQKLNDPWQPSMSDLIDNIMELISQLGLKECLIADYFLHDNLISGDRGIILIRDQKYVFYTDIILFIISYNCYPRKLLHHLHNA